MDEVLKALGLSSAEEQMFLEEQKLMYSGFNNKNNFK